MKNAIFTISSHIFFFSLLFTGSFSVISQISVSPIGEARLEAPDLEKHSFGDLNFRAMNWKEDVSKRTQFSATFVTTEGFIRVEHSQKPMHRKVGGAWEKIDPKMLPNQNGWHAPNQDFPVYLEENGAFGLTLPNGQTWYFGNETKYMSQAVNYELLSQNGQEFYFATSNITGLQKEILALENGVKYNYKLQTAPSLGEEDLVFTERIEIPKPYFLGDASAVRETYWGVMHVSQLLIMDKELNIFGEIAPAYAVDANGNSYPVNYDLVNLGEGIYDLKIILSNEWLTAAERQFPVIIDPLVVGPTTQWTGGQMPSCIAPQQNADSILITIPAGVTPIALAVSSSFYADPFSGAVMSQGAMQFSTNCGQSQSYQITSGPTVNQPGTAYLDSANMLSPLTCCFEKSCSEQQFYLRKLLSRTGPGSGCNTSFIRYDPFTTQWPFAATIYGRTPETSLAEWTVPQTPRCADQCEFNATAYVRYGVPPFTFTHPWQDTVIVEGSSNGCNTGQTNVQFQLTIPDCPILCDEDLTSLPVPNPTVIDACGVQVMDFPLKNLNLKPVPAIEPLSDTLFCAGETIDLVVANCLNDPNISWSAGDFSGTTSINIPTDPNLQGTFIHNVLIVSNVDGCDAEPLFQPIYVLPLPNVSFDVTGEETFLGDLISLQNTSTGVSLGANEWLWDFGDGNSSFGVNAEYTYNSVGNYEVCLSLAAGSECSNAYCEIIPIVPNTIDVPNVFSPNGDANNEVLNVFFDWAEKVDLQVMNRWGSVVAEVTITDFNGGWDGKVLNSGSLAPDGVYFYKYSITTTLGGTIEGHSFVHLVRE